MNLDRMLQRAGIIHRPKREVIQVPPRYVRRWEKKHFRVIAKHYYEDRVIAVFMARGAL